MSKQHHSRNPKINEAICYQLTCPKSSCGGHGGQPKTEPHSVDPLPEQDRLVSGTRTRNGKIKDERPYYNFPGMNLNKYSRVQPPPTFSRPPLPPPLVLPILKTFRL